MKLSLTSVALFAILSGALGTSANAADAVMSSESVTEDSQNYSQSVFRVERVVFVKNSDGTSSEQTIITVYYLNGIE